MTRCVKTFDREGTWVARHGQFEILMSPSEEAVAKPESLFAGIAPEQPLRTLLEYAGRIADERNLPRLIELVRNMGKAVVHADRCSVWVLDWEYDELYTVASEGVDQVRIPSDFDPKLVDALLACLPDILEIREQLNDPPGFFRL